MNELLRAEDLHKVYHNGAADVPVLQGVNLALQEGQIGVIVGPSGVGKSTLLHILGLLDTPTSGRLYYHGQNVCGLGAGETARLRNAELGFVFQFFHLLPDLTAIENVLLPGMIANGTLGWIGSRRRWRQSAEATLNRLGLAGRLSHRPSQLSGGEKQRVAIARALVHQPRIVFCDEPTGNLDEASALEIRSLLWDLNAEQGLTLLIVTHNPEFAQGAHWVTHMTRGRLEEFAMNGPRM